MTKGNRSLIDNYIEKIRQKGPLNSAKLERYLLLMNDLAGTKATATLKQSDNGFGASDLVITMEHDDVNGVLSADNSGTKFVGPGLITSYTSLNSAFKNSERIEATIISDAAFDELRYGQISYKQPIGTEGTHFKLSLGNTVSKPGSTIETLDVKGDTSTFSAELTYPIIRSRRENLSTRAVFDLKNTDTEIGSAELYRDKVRSFTFGATYDKADGWMGGGVNLADVSFTAGVSALGATKAVDLKSRANADGHFGKVNFEASRTQNLIDTTKLYIAAAGQSSNEALLASEEFGFGGREFGRGYEFSEITGDAGLAGKIELQHGFTTGQQYVNDMQAYVFYDIGKIWQRESALIAGEDASETAASTGVGLKFNVTKSVVGYTELAKPLTKERTSSGNKDARFNFGLSYLY